MKKCEKNLNRIFFLNNKKASHIGVILSFSIFIFFLIFLFSMLQFPIKIQKEKSFILNQFETELIKNCSDEMIIMNIFLKNTPNQQCFSFVNTTKFYKNIITRDENESVINSSFKDNKISINKKEYFYKIFSSESFETNGELKSCESLSSDNYTIGLLKKDNYIFEKKILELIKSYDENYAQMKNDFKIPESNEFDFSFTYDNGTTIGNKYLNISTNVYAKRVYIQYVDNDANILSGIIDLKIW